MAATYWRLRAHRSTQIALLINALAGDSSSNISATAQFDDAGQLQEAEIRCRSIMYPFIVGRSVETIRASLRHHSAKTTGEGRGHQVEDQGRRSMKGKRGAAWKLSRKSHRLLKA